MPETPTIETLCLQWADAFNARDLARHVRLYTADAMLFGSTDELYRGHSGVHDYFAGLPASVQISNVPAPAVTRLSDEVAVTAAHVDFTDGEKLLPYRLTWALVLRGGNWRIAQHHGSPRRGQT